jgi:hypothetical protein
MGLFLFRFWPVLIPLIIYWLWFIKIARSAEREGKPRPHFRDGPWFWAVLASLITGIGCFMMIGTSGEGNTGVYVPPHLENGTLVPGREGSR